MAKYTFELTDTFGGEANYSWCRRTTVEVPDGIGDGLLRMMAKQWAGFAGRRCEVEDFGDSMTIRPRGMCQVLFVSLDDSEPAETTLGDVRAWAQRVQAAAATEYASLVRHEEKLVAQAIVDACNAHRKEVAL